MVGDLLVDVAVAGGLPALAWAVGRSRTLGRAVILFISFGLTSALAWARLDAVDVALVEASVGAGLTGALFINALSWAPSEHEHAAPVPPWPLSACIVVAGTIAFAHVLLSLPEAGGLGAEVRAALPVSGVAQPVTAVLMNFRGYDTLIETMVLLVAAITVRSLQGGPSRSRSPETPEPIDLLVKVLLPVCILLAGYLVWKGSHGPGGAFQAGAVLAGGAVVLMLAGRLSAPGLSSARHRSALLVGPLVFVALAGSSLVTGGPLLAFPKDAAGALIFALECALTISIAIVLAMFFPAIWSGRAGSREQGGP